MSCCNDQLIDLRSDITFLKHQMANLISIFGCKTCDCQICSGRIKNDRKLNCKCLRPVVKKSLPKPNRQRPCSEPLTISVPELSEATSSSPLSAKLGASSQNGILSENSLKSPGPNLRQKNLNVNYSDNMPLSMKSYTPQKLNEIYDFVTRNGLPSASIAYKLTPMMLRRVLKIVGGSSTVQKNNSPAKTLFNENNHEQNEKKKVAQMTKNVSSSDLPKNSPQIKNGRWSVSKKRTKRMSLCDLMRMKRKIEKIFKRIETVAQRIQNLDDAERCTKELKMDINEPDADSTVDFVYKEVKTLLTDEQLKIMLEHYKRLGGPATAKMYGFSKPAVNNAMMYYKTKIGLIARRGRPPKRLNGALTPPPNKLAKITSPSTGAEINIRADDQSDANVKTRLRGQNLSFVVVEPIPTNGQYLVPFDCPSSCDSSFAPLANQFLPGTAAEAVNEALKDDKTSASELNLNIKANPSCPNKIGSALVEIPKDILSAEQEDQLFRVLHSCQQEGITINSKLLTYAAKQILKHGSSPGGDISAKKQKLSPYWTTKKLNEFRRRTF